MKIATVVCSYKSKPLTRRCYDQLRRVGGHDLYVLENSPTEAESFMVPETVHMGPENVGYGGMHDFIFKDPRFRQYDFVGIFNNDIYDIPSDFLEKLLPHFADDVGMISPSFNKEGTGWPHMRQLRGDGYREVGHVEDMAAYLNTTLFDKLTSFCPMQYYGILDVQLSRLYAKYGYRLLVIDDMQIGHMLAGAREMAGTKQEYIVRSSEEMNKWHENNPEVKEIYDAYMKQIGKSVTVIVSSYGYNNLIGRAIESALSQHDTDVVVVDDDSPESPLPSIGDLPVRYFKHDRNRGLGATRNTAIANSVSQWLLPLDSDDYLRPGAIERMLSVSQYADIIYGNLIYQHNKSRLVPNKKPRPNDFLSNNQIFGASLYRRELWEKVGGYAEDPPEFYEDWDFWGRCAKKGARFQYTPIDVYEYNGDAEGMCARVSKRREYFADIVRKNIQNA